jgi:hypothetical protein
MEDYPSRPIDDTDDLVVEPLFIHKNHYYFNRFSMIKQNNSLQECSATTPCGHISIDLIAVGPNQSGMPAGQKGASHY